jgi:hypothetical protein
MSDKVYLAAIKTRDSELRCFKNLKEEELDQLMPLYELTKSRKTKVAPDGDIHRRMKQIGEIQQGRPFILDLSTNEKYMNPQIDNLLNPSGGFLDWYYFVFENYKNLNIIPMIHIFEDDDGVAPEVAQFVRKASEQTDLLAVRFPYDLEVEDYATYFEPISNALGEGTKVIVILDAEYIRDKAVADIASVSDQYIESCRAFAAYEDKIDDIFMLCTSFPSNVAQTGKSDAEGEFEYYEEQIFQRIREELPIKYGDYVSINTQQIEMKGGTFVPRMDVSLIDGSNLFIYKRFRRHAGSYPLCAKKMIGDNRYTSYELWSSAEIELAAQDKPSGISPSYWISVRMHYYIFTRLLLRARD